LQFHPALQLIERAMQRDKCRGLVFSGRRDGGALAKNQEIDHDLRILKPAAFARNDYGFKMIKVQKQLAKRRAPIRAQPRIGNNHAQPRVILQQSPQCKRNKSV
jgi:hypothetical protein